MADYKEIIGFDIEAKSDNPTNAVTGEIWFNTTTGKLSYKKADGANTWSTGGDLNVGRRLAGGTGTQTAALMFAGIGVTPPHAGISQTLTEEYNGSSWTEVADLPEDGYQNAAYGTQTAAGSVGMLATPTAKRRKHVQYNGTSWTETTGTSTDKQYSKADGTQTAALTADSASGGTELWNGSSWTEVNDLNEERLWAASCGESTSMLFFGGSPNGAASSGKTESWNGTSWTEVNDIATARYFLSGAGSQTAALAFNGQNTKTTQQWNGTSWTEVNDMSLDMNQCAGSGTQTSALAFGSQIPGNATKTEEWNPVDNTQTVDDA